MTSRRPSTTDHGRARWRWPWPLPLARCSWPSRCSRSSCRSLLVGRAVLDAADQPGRPRGAAAEPRDDGRQPGPDARVRDPARLPPGPPHVPRLVAGRDRGRPADRPAAVGRRAGAAVRVRPPGLLGGALEVVGHRIPFTTFAVVLAQTFVAAPFYVRSARTGIAGVDRDTEDAARSTGRPSAHVFRWVTVPLAGTALAAGIVMSWSRALGEFGATIMFAGNIEGRTQTLPLVVYCGVRGRRPRCIGRSGGDPRAGGVRRARLGAAPALGPRPRRPRGLTAGVR